MRIAHPRSDTAETDVLARRQAADLMRESEKLGAQSPRWDTEGDGFFDEARGEPCDGEDLRESETWLREAR